MRNETVIQMYLLMTSAQFENANRWMNPDDRQELTGRICSFCATPLPQETARRQTYCDHCPPAEAHHIRLEFRFLRRRWHCGFWDADAGEMLPARLCFEHADSLYALAQRGRGFIGGGRVAEAEFFNAVGTGRGAICLTLNEPQYQALRSRCQTTTVPTTPVHLKKEIG